MGWSIRWASSGLSYWKPVLCCPLGHNYDPNGVVCDKFRCSCSYKTKSRKCMYFMSFPTEIKSIHCNAIWVWHPRDIFVYLFLETGGKQINLWTKLKLVTQILNNLWESIYSVLSLKTLEILSAIVFSAPRMGLEEIRKPLFCANSHIRFTISLQITGCMPSILLMYANAVLGSVKIWTCLTLQLCLKYDFRANKMAFSSNALI